MRRKSYNDLLGFISVGRENAISLTDLSNLSGISPREVKRQIMFARKDGIIVCSGDEGYFKPENLAELADYYKRFHSSAITTLSCLKATRRELRRNGIDPKLLEGGR